MSTSTKSTQVNEAVQQLEQSLVQEFDSRDNDPTTDLTTLDQVAQAIKVVRALPAGNVAPTHTGVTTTSRPSLTEVANQTTINQATIRSTTITASVTIPSAPGDNDLTNALYQSLTTGVARQSTNLDTPHTVASLTWDYPAERQITTDDPTITTDQLTAALTPNQPKSLVAYGGICEPVSIDYSIPSFTSAKRPIRDGLPAFQATRGGIRFTPPPTLTQAGGAVTVWTAAMDVAGTATKACLTLACGTPQEQIVSAIATCVQLGNMQQRYSPEFVQAWLDNVNAASARTAELALLTVIDAGSTKVTQAANGLGAARDLLPTIDQAAAGLRYRNRVDRQNPTIRFLGPDWLKDLLRADIAQELAHDNDTDATDALALADSRLNNFFSQRNISPIWALDDLTAPPFNAQATGALATWPTDTTFYLFHEGSWVFLDGGRLDLGFVRDSTLNSTNNVQMFAETFEAVAFRGLESVAITMPLTPTGASSSSVVPT